MTISLPTAKRLCTAREYALVLSSRPRAVRTLSDREVRVQVERARKTRDAFRARARSQRREQRGTVRPRGARRADGNQRTVEKEKLFAQVLGAFTADLSRRKAAEKASPGKSKRIAVKAKGVKAKAVKTRGVETAAVKMKAGKTRAKPKSAARSATSRSAPTKRATKAAAQTKTKTKRKANVPKARATAKKRAGKSQRQPTPAAAPTETAALAMLPPSPAQVAPDPTDDHGMAGNRAAIHQPIPAITRRGRSLLATDVSGKQSMKRIPRAQRRARYGSVSALGRRNQARRDSRG